MLKLGVDFEGLLDDRLRLDKSFFNRHSVEVAKDLLGKVLVFNEFKGIITETEAYRGLEDEASHAFRGMTPRTEVMFGEPGYSYVYFIYGMYHCLNIVTEGKGTASAVLLRGLLLPSIHLNGPGKLCRYLGITREHSAINLIGNESFYVTEGVDIVTYDITPRIGITKAIDKPWRFVLTSFK